MTVRCCRDVTTENSSQASGHSQQTLEGLSGGIAGQLEGGDEGAGWGMSVAIRVQATDDCVAGAGPMGDSSPF